MLGTLLGPYRLEKELGSGGMGVVYAATLEEARPGLGVGERVALKLVHPQGMEAEGAFERFQREVDVGRLVEHPNVVRTYEGGTVDGRPYIAMEFVQGETLQDLVNELERVPEELCRHIARQVTAGLAAIHAVGAVHRDIKPENVMITPQHVVKIMDLGIARSIDDALRLSQTGAFVGSLQYACPEQLTGGGKGLDGRVDLHALGLVLYELATGWNPIRGEDLAEVVRNVLNLKPRRMGELNPQLSPFFEEVVHKLVEKDRDDRFATSEELLEVLEQGEDSAWWRGRAQALRAETKRPLRRIRIPRETAVYGRDEELARLRGLYDLAAAGAGQVLLLDGEAGVGKSRLVDEMIGRLQADGQDFNFMFGSYPPGGAATASGAFSTAYSEQLGETGAADVLSDMPSLIPAFEAMLRGEAPPDGVQPLSKDALQACFVQATFGIASERPTVILIDDLHFAPEDGRAMFAALAMAVAQMPVLLVGTTRPGMPESWLSGLTRMEQTTALSVPRLAPEHIFKLLRDTFQSDRLAREVGKQISEKSDGNPFFVFEIVNGLREGRFIAVREDGAWETTQFIDEIQIPSSVLDLVNARVAELDEEERDLLEIAACCGYEFEPTLVAAVCGLGAIPALKKFGRIEKGHRLVRSSGSKYVFDHHNVQEVLYEAMHPALREQYHAAIADALETRERAADGDVSRLDGGIAVQLCEHLLRGGQPDRVARYLERALDHLEAAYDTDRAVDLSMRALEANRGIEPETRMALLLRTASGLNHLGRRDDEGRVLEESLALAQSLDSVQETARVRERLGLHRLLLGRYQEAHDLLEVAVREAHDAGDAVTEAAAMGKLGNALYVLGRRDEARARHEEQFAIAERAGDERGQALACGNLGILDWAAGRYAEAREQYGLYLALCRAMGDRRNEAIATSNLGQVYSTEGDLTQAAEHYRRSAEISGEIGFRLGEATATGNLGAILIRLGRFDESLECYGSAIALGEAVADLRGVLRARDGRGYALAALGRFADALKAHERTIALASELGNLETELKAIAGAAGAELSLGRIETAVERLRPAVHRAIDAEQRTGEGLLRRELGNAFEQLGILKEARQELELSLEASREVGDGLALSESAVALGRLLARIGEVDAARPLFEEAREAARGADAADPEILAGCHLAALPEAGVAASILVRSALTNAESRLRATTKLEAHFLLWQATGNRDELVTARTVLERLMDHLDEGDFPTMLGRVRLHQHVLTAASQEGIEIEPDEGTSAGSGTTRIDV
jgi:tetratricopeptide (TPR) repeat protein